MAGSLERPACKLCKRPVDQTSARAFKLGTVMFVTCEGCAPLVMAGTAAAGEAIEQHVKPAFRKWLSQHPVLGAALRGYERSRHNQ